VNWLNLKCIWNFACFAESDVNPDDTTYDGCIPFITVEVEWDGKFGSLCYTVTKALFLRGPWWWWRIDCGWRSIGSDVLHCRILSPDKTEWRLISATLCGWRCCFVACSWVTDIQDYGYVHAYEKKKKTRHLVDNSYFIVCCSVGKFKMFSDRSCQTCAQFKKDKRATLTYNESQVHKYDKFVQSFIFLYCVYLLHHCCGESDYERVIMCSGIVLL